MHMLRDNSHLRKTFVKYIIVRKPYWRQETRYFSAISFKYLTLLLSSKILKERRHFSFVCQNVTDLADGRLELSKKTGLKWNLRGHPKAADLELIG